MYDAPVATGARRRGEGSEDSERERENSRTRRDHASRCECTPLAADCSTAARGDVRVQSCFDAGKYWDDGWIQEKDLQR